MFKQRIFIKNLKCPFWFTYTEVSVAKWRLSQVKPNEVFILVSIIILVCPLWKWGPGEHASLCWWTNCGFCCRTRQNGLWTTLRCSPGSSSVCPTWLSTLTGTCWWWRTWTTPVRPRSSSRGCRSSSPTCSSSSLPESESTDWFRTPGCSVTPAALQPHLSCPPPGAADAFRSRKDLGTFWAVHPSSWPSCCSGTSDSLLLTVSLGCQNVKPAVRDGRRAAARCCDYSLTGKGKKNYNFIFGKFSFLTITWRHQYLKTPSVQPSRLASDIHFQYNGFLFGFLLLSVAKHLQVQPLTPDGSCRAEQKK